MLFHCVVVLHCICFMTDLGASSILLLTITGSSFKWHPSRGFVESQKYTTKYLSTWEVSLISKLPAQKRDVTVCWSASLEFSTVFCSDAERCLELSCTPFHNGTILTPKMLLFFSLHFPFFLFLPEKKSNGVFDLWGHMVIVLQNKLFSQKKND